MSSAENELLNTSAGRLLFAIRNTSIVSQAKEFNRSEYAEVSRVIFSSLSIELGIYSDDTLGAKIAILSFAQKIREDVAKSEEHAEAVMDALTKFVSAIIEDISQPGDSDFSSTFSSPHFLMALELAHLKTAKGKSSFTPPDYAVVKDHIVMIEEIMSEISNDDCIDLAVRKRWMKELFRLQSSMTQYRCNGPAGVRSALNELAGFAAMEHAGGMNLDANKTVWKRVFGFFREVYPTYAIARDGAPYLLESSGKIIDVAQQIIEKSGG